jgi:threonine dehydrogenase-like Zn-dependent dehydrogenase
MIEVTPKKLEMWKSKFAEMGIHYETDDEYIDAVNNLTGFFDVLIEMDLEQKRKKSETTGG